MRYLVGIPCLYGSEHTKLAIESVARTYDVDLLLIDNGAEKSVKDLIKTYEAAPDVFVISNPENVYVNPAWNQIINFFLLNDKYDYLVIMNSDLILQKDWKKVMDFYFKVYPDVIPLPVIGSDSTVYDKEIELVFEHHEVFKGTPGVLIVINRKHAKIVYPIPDYIKVWFGDNWIFEILRSLKYRTIVIQNLLAYHAWSQNVNKVEGIHEIIEQDKIEWHNNGHRDMNEKIKTQNK